MEEQTQQYDVILIGSGIGALTFAAIMARLQQKRVLVLERHFKAGGFTHAFQRHGYSWDVGLHYVGEMQEGSQSRVIFDYITRSQLQWQSLPDSFEMFHYPDLDFAVPADKERYLQSLIQRFPHEELALRQYFHDLEFVAEKMSLETLRWSMPGPLRYLLKFASRDVRRLAAITTQEYLDQHFHDERLKALLISQWMDYGVPPEQGSFVGHARVASSYFRGAWYPVGGGDRVFETIEPVITDAGGACLVNHEVQEILVEKGRAYGVRVAAKHGRRIEEKRFFAPLVVSDAGAYLTFNHLLPKSVHLPVQDKLARSQAGMTTITLYMGLKESPRSLGMNGENHWCFSGYDHNDPAHRGFVNGQVMSGFLSFPSLKDPSATQHTAELLVVGDYQMFARWRDTEWKKRGAEYEALKQEISIAMLEAADRYCPGLRALVDYYELSTPVTIEGFTGYRGGSIYGLPATPEKYAYGLGAFTPIKGLMLTGTDICSLGIVGALMGGMISAGAAIGLNGVPRIMEAAYKAAAAEKAEVLPPVAVATGA